MNVFRKNIVRLYYFYSEFILTGIPYFRVYYKISHIIEYLKAQFERQQTFTITIWCWTPNLV